VVIATLFLTAFLRFDASVPVALLFVAAMFKHEQDTIRAGYRKAGHCR